MSPNPLIILNSDDWGSSEATTDAILECFAAGATTSTTAMVFMQDSERAATIAIANQVPVGLHINLTQRFDALGLSNDLQQQHRTLVRRFRPRRIPTSRYRIYPGRWHYSERLMRAVSQAIEAQLAEFRRLYGNEPTHFDGHHDVHLCPSVWRSAALPKGARVRNTHHYYVNKNALASRFVFPEAFVSMQDVILSQGRLLRGMLERENVWSVEVSQHPGHEEKPYLLSEGWLNIVGGLRTGSFLDLQNVRLQAPRDR